MQNTVRNHTYLILEISTAESRYILSTIIRANPAAIHNSHDYQLLNLGFEAYITFVLCHHK